MTLSELVLILEKRRTEASKAKATTTTLFHLNGAEFSRSLNSNFNIVIDSMTKMINALHKEVGGKVKFKKYSDDTPFFTGSVIPKAGYNPDSEMSFVVGALSHLSKMIEGLSSDNHERIMDRMTNMAVELKPAYFKAQVLCSIALNELIEDLDGVFRHEEVIEKEELEDAKAEVVEEEEPEELEEVEDAEEEAPKKQRLGRILGKAFGKK